MRSCVVEVGVVALEDKSEVILAANEHVVEALGTHAAQEVLADGVGIRCLDRRAPALALPPNPRRALWCPMGGAVPADIDHEARIFARYLLRANPPEDLFPRYREAVGRLLPGPDDAHDRALAGFVQRHPWAVGYLDAAAALLSPKSRLRARLLIMAALCETTPEGAAEFLPREPGLATILLRLPAIGLVAAWRIIAGVVVYAVAVAGA